MSAPADARERLLASYPKPAPDEPAWLATLRQEGRDSFAEQGLPTTRQEEWRYTNLAPLARMPFEAAPSEAPRVSREDVEELAIPVFACSLFVFVDGRFAPELSTPDLLAGDVAVGSLARLRAEQPERLEPHLGRLVDLKEHSLAALNTAFLDDGAVLIVPDGVHVERPMHAVFVATGAAGRVAQPRVLFSVGAGSRATLIQDHVALGAGPGFTNAVTEIDVGRDARADFVLLQREAGERYHLSNVQVRQDRDSRFVSHAISLGGNLVRNDLGALLAGEGAECELDGLYVGDAEQHLDNHTRVDHAVPRGTSRELYKGILAGRSRGVFRGRVIVRPDAQHTNAEQSNPNLLLSDGAEIDTKPQLEIHADDVKCSHGSAIGQADPAALFYLRSRGIAERAARDLLARGFASDVTRRLPLDAVREVVDQLVLEKLAQESA